MSEFAKPVPLTAKHDTEDCCSHYGFTRLPTETPTYALDLVKFANPERPPHKLNILNFGIKRRTGH
ncbi:MAG: hypothetical protein PHU14_07815 [Methylovulum sp.]|nr:hypothetical protein [Methylovulum sp.]